MKRLVLVLVCIPAFLFAQNKPSGKSRTKPAATVKPASQDADGFVIEGTVTGYPDGTKISLLNGQTGQPEQQGGIYQNKFRFTGKVAVPSFKVILVNQQPPYLTLFIDNSNIRISATSTAFDKAEVTGSPVHDEYVKLSNVLTPYQAVLTGSAQADENTLNSLKASITNYLQANGKAYPSPMAIIRYTQVTEDFATAETWFKLLHPEVQKTDMAQYVSRQIAENKVNGIGTIMDNFTQADTSGKPLSLSAFRGKYVLVDFWASWCRPCRQENPNVVANFLKYRDKNFTVLGVSLDKSKPAWLEAISADQLTWSHVSDLQGWGNAVAQQFRINSIPQNFLIGPDGKIIAKNLRGPALESRLAQLLK